MKTIARSLILSLSMLVAAAGCVEPVDTERASSEDVTAEAPDDERSPPTDKTPIVDEAPAEGEGEVAPAWPICITGNALGGRMKGVGWTCEIKPAGSDLCCDVALGLTCARVPWHPTRTECKQVQNPNNPNPAATR